jgi:hypothetical protein
VNCEAESYDQKNAWASINRSILSAQKHEINRFKNKKRKKERKKNKVSILASMLTANSKKYNKILSEIVLFFIISLLLNK